MESSRIPFLEELQFFWKGSVIRKPNGRRYSSDLSAQRIQFNTRLPLQDHSLVSHSPRDALLVQIFEQRDREFPAHSREVFEFTHTDRCAFGLQSLDVGYEFIDSGPVNQHLLIDFDQRILFEHQLN